MINKEIDINKDVSHCEGCGGLFLIDSLREVVQRDQFYGNRKSLFCKNCKPKFDAVTINWPAEPQYFKEMEVDRDGNPVGYVKIKEKKK